MNSLGIVTIGDESFFETIKLNLENVKRLYPESFIIIGDVGFSEEQVQYFLSKKFMVVDCMKRRSRDEAGKKFPLYAMTLKPMMMILIAFDKLVWIDGDAVVLKNFDELLNYDVHIVATVRESIHGKINTGFIVFPEGEQRDAVLREWIDETTYSILAKKSELDENLCEQWAFNRVCDSGMFRVAEVPCSIYNYTKVEDGIPDEVKVVHMKKGRRFNKELMQRVRDASGVA